MSVKKIPFYSSTGTIDNLGEAFFRELNPGDRVKVIFIDGSEEEMSATEYLAFNKTAHKPIMNVKVWEESKWKP